MKQPYSLLYVEENSALCKAVTDFLQSENIDAHSAHDVNTALKITRKLKPDMILLADNIGRERGIFFLEQLYAKSEKWKKIPIIWVCSHVYPQQVQETLRHGGVDAITKPFSLITLLEMVQMHLKNMEENYA